MRAKRAISVEIPKQFSALFDFVMRAKRVMSVILVLKTPRGQTLNTILV